ncbi:hypothetical protein Q9L58_007542 [Maublancomyces gigas]|uniref:Uncharacterized protein n=1 Tax=Discina gigas TaxID=1032678 RepID=A0ABR3GD00_9PEZI
MVVFWLVAVGLGAADITKAAAGSNHQYCVGAFTEKYFRRLGCLAPKARLGIEVLILVLYIIATTMAALAHDRYTTFLRSEVHAQRCSHYTPTTTFRREPIPPKPISAAPGISEDIAPEVPQKAARRMSSWIPEESDTPRVFGQKQDEGTRRVLSVRNV